MKTLKILACLTIMVFTLACTVPSTNKDGTPKKKYDFDTCVQKYMELSGPSADDGDKHSGEMMCAPCSMPGGRMNCKKIIESMGE
jgi:hypothetical protein